MAGADEIRRLSDELAREPGSMAFLRLAELLQAQGQPAAARRLAERGAFRHPAAAEAHDLLARLAAERGDVDEALAAWDRCAAVAGDGERLAARARQAQAFCCFTAGRLAEADAYLDAAARCGGDPAAVAAARARVRARFGDPSGAALFDALLEDGDRAALLVDREGQVAAGRCAGTDGTDVGAAVAKALGGVGEEATRAMRHLALGSWQAIVVEAEDALIALAPAGAGVALVATAASTPLGRLRRLLERVSGRASAWRRAS